MSALKKALIGILLVAGVVASLLVAQEASARGRGGIGRPGVGPGGVARRPVPVAGVARRTTRRVVRRSAIYVTALPYGCTTVVIDTASYYQCGATYYVASGTRYEVVYVDGGSGTGSGEDEDDDDEGDDD